MSQELVESRLYQMTARLLLAADCEIWIRRHHLC